VGKLETKGAKNRDHPLSPPFTAKDDVITVCPPSPPLFPAAPRGEQYSDVTVIIKRFFRGKFEFKREKMITITILMTS